MLSSIIKILVMKILICLLAMNGVNALLEGFYCGDQNCYDVLGVTRDSTTQEISRAYRLLARKWHPDLHRTEEAKKLATEKFQVIATAYEVLRDEESRNDYNYMLDNPEEMYAHYYRYYRRVYAPKIDVRIVIIVTISVVSAFQYYAAYSRYKEAIDYLLSVPKYRLRAQEIAKNEGLIGNSAANRKKNKFRSKDDIRLEEENILRTIIVEKMDIRGGYSKPSYRDVLWVQIVFFPYTVLQYIYWYVRWFWKFTLKKEPYGDEEKLYIMRKFMGLSQNQWDALPEEEVQEYVDNELWLKENFDPWKQQRDDELKAQLAESSSYKRYRRFMKKGGPGQMTFLED